MGLTRWLLRQAAMHPRPLVVTAVYGTRARLLTEAELARRSWVPADAPGEANLLIVCGHASHELDEAVRTVWSDMSGPRARVDVPSEASPHQVTQALEHATEQLGDAQAQWQDAAARVAAPWVPGSSDAGDQAAMHEGGHGTSDEHEHEGGGHLNQEQAGGEAEHGAHGGHGGGHHEHHMGSPGGLPMAERGPDRDGLSLDRLHVPLGPILADWPSGLVVETVLQGDVIQEATVKVMPGIGTGGSFWDEPWIMAAEGHPVSRAEAERRWAAARLDGLGRLLAVAGWASAAGQGRSLRDRLLADAPPAELAPPYTRFARRVRRSRTLRWMLRNVGAIGEGDALSRLERWLAATSAAIAALDDNTPLEEQPPSRHEPEGLLPHLLIGAELATARLIVASLDPDLDRNQVAHV
ncbi:hypothetical protein [Nonomuraea africana]|uniref:hypothetical protein n=1 Tax=Nonomuraea africana TaxID=46171 RepID=UPI0034064507